MYSFNQDSGSVAWSKSTGGYVYGGRRRGESPGLGSEHLLRLLRRDRLRPRRGQRPRALVPARARPVSGAGSVVGDVFYVGELKTTQTFGFRVSDGKKVLEFRDGAYNPVISNGRRLFLTGYRMIYPLHPAQGARLRAKGGTARRSARAAAKERRRRKGKKHNKGGKEVAAAARSGADGPAPIALCQPTRAKVPARPRKGA